MTADVVGETCAAVRDAEPADLPGRVEDRWTQASTRECKRRGEPGGPGAEDDCRWIAGARTRHEIHSRSGPQVR